MTAERTFVKEFAEFSQKTGKIAVPIGGGLWLLGFSGVGAPILFAGGISWVVGKQIETNSRH